MPGLLTSPPELLLSILARCDVFSVYALRRTCKPLYDLTHERVVWIAQLIRAYEEVDAPLAQFNLDAMSASDIEARVTSRFRLTRTIRTSSRNARMNAPLSHRIIKSPPGTTWRAISSCPGGQWMAAVVGRELQIWDTSFVGGSPAPLASLEVKNLAAKSPVWIRSYFSSGDYHVLLVYQRTFENGSSGFRQSAFELRVKDPGLLSLNFRGDMSGPDLLSFRLDRAQPNGPLLGFDFLYGQLQFWYPETGEQLYMEVSNGVRAKSICFSRGFLLLFDHGATTITIAKAPSKGELLQLTHVPVVESIDFLDELGEYCDRGYSPAHVRCSEVITSKDPDHPMARFVVICEFKLGPTKRELITFHKAIFLDEADGHATFCLKTISVSTASAFPDQNKIAMRPSLKLGMEWFLWWPIGNWKAALYLLGNSITGAEDCGALLHIGTDNSWQTEKGFEFDSMGGRAICPKGDTLHFFSFA